MTADLRVDDLRRVMSAHPDLGVFGWVERRPGESKEAFAWRRREARREMLASFPEFQMSVVFLRRCPSSRSGGSSYGLKHIAERLYGSTGYIANGMLIAAALHLGLEVKRYPRSPNCMVPVSTRWTEGGRADGLRLIGPHEVRADRRRVGAKKPVRKAKGGARSRRAAFDLAYEEAR